MTDPPPSPGRRGPIAISTVNSVIKTGVSSTLPLANKAQRQAGTFFAEMKFVILCGGVGSRLLKDTVFPKPLNLVSGVPLISHVIESIPSEELFFILNSRLEAYNFETAVHHLTKKKVSCVYLERQTRGPIETALLGVQQFNFDPHEAICFLDNDTIYSSFVIPSGHHFIGYSVLKDSLVKGGTANEYPYCFVRLGTDDTLLDLSEKETISSTYACGIYGFKSLESFGQLALATLTSEHYAKEYYMSLLYTTSLSLGDTVLGVRLPTTVCLGTPADIARNLAYVPTRKLRVCFDIDNTLLKYRIPGQSYGECDCVTKLVFLLRRLKDQGHTIILYTARGMKTSKQNVGKAMKDVALETFASLEKHRIPYDEIYFGKPDADFYIDDKAFNPYMELYTSIGFPTLEKEFESSLISRSNTNKFNTVVRLRDSVIKTGPSSSMKGELFFYETVKNTSLAAMFPRYVGSTIEDDITHLQLEYIDGITLFELLRDKLLSNHHLLKLIKLFDDMHQCIEVQVTILKSQIYDNYMGKLKARVSSAKDYPFDNKIEVISKIDAGVRLHLDDANVRPVSIVHGDPWFSNTILTRDNRFVFLDMKGDISGHLTTNGDILTDYCKVLQSLLGFDYIVNSVSYDKSSLAVLERFYVDQLISRGFQLNSIYSVTACLIAKTLSFLEVDISIRAAVWNIVVGLTEKLQLECA